MRLTFDENDEQPYFETCDELLDEMEDSLRSDRPGATDVADIVASVSMLLDWRWNYSTGQLDDWALVDVDEFLLDWLPRKYAGPPEEGVEVCSSVADFFVHMGARKRLIGGVDRAAALVARAYELSGEVVEAMGDPSRFGMAKSLFSTALSDGAGNPLADIGAMIESGVDADDPELQAMLQERMDAFNALPFEQRMGITGGPMPAISEPQRIPIPVVEIPPSIDDVVRSAAASRLITLIDGLVDHVGTKGIAVTQSGNLRLADAEHLVKLLDTGDVWDRTLPWNDEPAPVRTSADLPWLTLVFDVAEHAGALLRLKTKVKVDPDWLDLAVTERAREIIDALMEVGPVSSAAHWEVLFQIASLLEDGIPHWLAMALPEGAEIVTEPFVDQAIELVDQYMPTRPVLWTAIPGHFEEMVARQVYEVFDVLVVAGVIEWHDRVEMTGSYDRTYQGGGWFRLTALGRHTMVSHIRAAGYDFSTITDLATAGADDLVNAAMTTDSEPSDLLRRWRPDASTTDRANALAGFAMRADEPLQRLLTMTMLAELEPLSDVEPAVRQMLDSASAGHATLFLLENGLAQPDEIGSFFDIGPLVDMLSTLLDAPEVLCGLFMETYAASDKDLIEDLWRHDQPETIEILEVLGKHLPDKQLAKATRKAAIKHRSWMANLHR